MAKLSLDTLPPAGRCNGTALRKAMRRVSQLYDDVLAPSGLRGTQRSILMHIALAGRPSMGELASMLVLDRSALTRNLKPLERDGFVRIVSDDHDRRTRLAELTEVGREKVIEAMPLWQEAQRRFEAAFGASLAAELRATLGVLASNEFAAAFKRRRD